MAGVRGWSCGKSQAALWYGMIREHSSFRAEVASRVAASSLNHTAKQLGVGREVLARVLAELPIRRGSEALLRAALASAPPQAP